MSGEVDDPPAPAPPVAINAPTLAVLEALRGGGGDPGKALIGALAGQAGGGPQIDMLLKVLGEQDGSATDRLRDELREEVRAEQAEAVADLGETARRLFAEKEASRLRLDTLAAALGACPVCFGDDVLCDTCHGAGAPGGRAPDPAEFRHYVVPALDRVRRAVRRARMHRPWPPRPAGDPTDPPAITRGGMTS